MKKTTIIFSIFLTFFFNQKCYSQKECTDFAENIFKFINALEGQINETFSREKAKSLDRKLGYLNNDLKNYLIERKTLTEELSKTNYSTVTIKNSKSKIVSLKNKIEKIEKSIKNLLPYVDEDLSITINDYFKAVYDPNKYQQNLYLTQLMNALEGGKIDKKQLSEEGDKIYLELVNSQKLITKLKRELRIKYKL